MKKVLLAVLVVFFATALYAGDDVDPLAVGTQAARDKVYKNFGNPQVQFDLSGEFDARGYYWDNATILKDRKIDTDYYRGYMDLWPKLKIGDTQLITKLEMVDQNPWAPYLNTPTNNYSDSFDQSFNNLSLSKKNNISVERAYIHHNFNDAIFLEAGLMDGQWWGTSFWDNQQPRYRIKIQDNKTPVGVVGALVEKDAELGKNIDGTYSYGSQRDDYDAYAVYGVTKAGDIYISPLLFYVKDSSFTTLAAKNLATPLGAADLYLTGLDQGKNGLTVIYYALAFNGKLGPLSMEAEVGLKDYRSQIMKHLVSPGTLTDLNAALIPATLVKNNWDEWGAYLNLWNDMDFGRAGAWVAYGSYDKRGGPLKTGDGMDFWDDFKSNLILGDEIGFGSSSAQDLVGMSEIKPYVKYVKLGPDKLTGSASFGYIRSNQKDSAFDGVKAYELDLGVQYKLTKNLLYKIDAGYAKVKY
ncbi:MAG: hypothetical protein ABSC14_08820, partial [Desulfomonilia bacterium]